MTCVNPLQIVLLLTVPVWSGPYDKYVVETARTTDIDAQATQDLVAQLRDEVQRVLDAGPLAPLRMSYADIPYEAYWLYYERGRIITTLAYAYPHVDDRQQQEIRGYVRRLLSDPAHAPYEPGIKQHADGAPRALHGRAVQEGRYISHFGITPTLHVLYGLWLYGDRSGDWSALEPYWDRIAARYRDGLREPRLYGQMSAHIAVARMARRFGDEAVLATATEALTEDFDAGRKVDNIVQRLPQTRFAHFQQPRNRGHFPGSCWIFLNACPEVLRFLGDYQKEPTLQRTAQLKSRYPLWWLQQAPYFTRWTGDEGVGVTPELMGMVFPVERWVAETDSATLVRCMRSTPVGIGDCYWLEALVQAIEACGQTRWQPLVP